MPLCIGRLLYNLIAEVMADALDTTILRTGLFMRCLRVGVVTITMVEIIIRANVFLHTSLQTESHVSKLNSECWIGMTDSRIREVRGVIQIDNFELLVL